MDARDSGLQLSLSFTGAQPLAEVLGVALDACRSLALPAPDEARACVIIEELLANLYDYAGLGPEGAVVLRLSREAEHLHLILEDSGRAFDPCAAPSASNIPDRGGGAGLNLVRHWAERLTYAAGSPRNRLELWLPIRS